MKEKCGQTGTRGNRRKQGDIYKTHGTGTKKNTTFPGEYGVDTGGVGPGGGNPTQRLFFATAKCSVARILDAVLSQINTFTIVHLRKNAPCIFQQSNYDGHASGARR